MFLCHIVWTQFNLAEYIKLVILLWLFWLAPPKIVPFDFGDIPSNFEDSVSVNCLISSGDLPIDIEWLFNGEAVNIFAGVSVMRGGKRTSLLTIDSVHAGHAGNYTCKAKNRADSTEYSAELIVNG